MSDDPIKDAAEAGNLRYAAFPLADHTTYVCETEWCEGRDRRAGFMAFLYGTTEAGPLVHAAFRECGDCHALKTIDFSDT